MNFYTTIDEVFQNMFDKYGETDELIAYKEKLLDSYMNEGKYKANQIYQQIKPRLWTIVDGEFKLL